MIFRMQSNIIMTGWIFVVNPKFRDFICDICSPYIFVANCIPN